MVQGPAQDVRVALVVLDDEINVAVERSPDIQSPRRLRPETRVTARQRQARADTYPVIRVIGHRGPSPPHSGTHGDPQPRWFPAPPLACHRYQGGCGAPG